MSAAPKCSLTLATAEDAEAIASLRNAIADMLTFAHGKGPWTTHHTTAGALADLRTAKLYVVIKRDEVIASLKLSPKPPWSGAPVKIAAGSRPYFLSALLVAPEFHRRGYGRACVDEAAKLARRAKADTLITAIYDHAALEAHAFLTRTNFREIAHSESRGTGLRGYARSL
jgi:GNAT superfamily N-acetyltransferase